MKFYLSLLALVKKLQAENFVEPDFKAAEFLPKSRLMPLKGQALNGSPVYAVMESGDRLYEYKNAQVLFDENLELIRKIIYASDGVIERKQALILPMIKRMIGFCSIAPASEGKHDAVCGGLVRHSLQTAYEALKILPAVNTGGIDAQTHYSLSLALIYLGLAHDLGKIFTDVKIFDPQSGERFNPFIEGLDTFGQRNDCKFLAVRFVKGRGLSHHDYLPWAATVLADKDFEYFNEIGERFDFSKVALNPEPFLKRILNLADATAASLPGSPAGDAIDSAAAIKHQITTDLLNEKSLEQDGLIYTSGGVLIRRDSSYLKGLADKFYEFVSGLDDSKPQALKENFMTNARTKGLFKIPGSLCMYRWYQLEKQRRLYFVNAVLVPGIYVSKSPDYECLLLDKEATKIARTLELLKGYGFSKVNFFALKSTLDALSEVELCDVDFSSVRDELNKEQNLKRAFESCEALTPTSQCEELGKLFEQESPPENLSGQNVSDKRDDTAAPKTRKRRTVKSSSVAKTVKKRVVKSKDQAVEPAS